MPADVRETFWISQTGTLLRRLMLALLTGLLSGVIGELYSSIVYGPEEWDY